MFKVNDKTRSEFIICLLLVVLILAAYWQLPTHEFLNLDDSGYITHNSHVKEGITWKNIIWAFSSTDIAYWHPLTWLSQMLGFQLFGMNSSMHHLMNLFFHIANSLLLFIVLNRMTGSLWKSAFIAALFSIHPLNVESVAWISERKNVLSTFFWMLTILTYLRYNERPNFYRYLLTIFVFVLGLMSKPMLVTLPFVLLLLDYWPLNRFTLLQLYYKEHGFRHLVDYESRLTQDLRLVLEKIPLLFLSAVSIYLSSLSFQRFGVAISTVSVPMKLRIANALISYTAYLKKMVWPYKLAVYYPYPKVISMWEVAGAGLFMICVTLFALRRAKEKPYFALGWLWFIGTLFPVIGLVQAGLWPSIADRFTYVPLIGVFIIIAWGVPDLMSRWRYKKLIITTVAIAIIWNFTATTRAQNKYWVNNIALFKHALDVTNENDIAHEKLGEALANQGKTNEAVRHYFEALRINPKLSAAHMNLGVALRMGGQLEEAIKHFSKVLHMNPNSAGAYYEIGVTLEKMGKFDEAIRYFSKALRINPNNARLHNYLGIVLARQKKESEAIFHFSEALRIDPNDADANYNLGIIFADQKNIKQAIRRYKRALNLNPNMTKALYNLSWILATCNNERYRNGKEAVELATQLCNITKFRQPLSLDALAAAYAESKEFDAAVLTAEKGLKLAVHQRSKELVLGLKKRLELYQKKRPYRQSFR
jgi:tetratricopeptide (TPR) repeat protein